MAGCALLTGGGAGGDAGQAAAAKPAAAGASAPAGAAVAKAPAAAASAPKPVTPAKPATAAASGPARGVAAATGGSAPAGATPGAPTTPTPPGPGAAPPAPPPAPGQPPPFATIIKDTKKIDGLFAVWQKDERIWLELQPSDFDKPFFLSPKIASGIGEAMVFGGLMVNAPNLVQFRRVYNQVQLVALNSEQVAQAGTPAARAVAVAASVSLLASTGVASQPHPDRKSVLVDGNALFMGDMLGIAAHLQRSFRQGYGFDARNSVVSQVRGKPDLLVVEVNGHYATGAIAVPQPGAPPGVPMPSVPQGLPDPRSMFIKLHYSLARLPEKPMQRRPADPRVGYFENYADDFTDDLVRSPRQRFVSRWRLDKKDPDAPLSEPVKPITYWLDRNIPVKYRGAITEGVLEWNKAFERIGFKNAIEVKQQPDDADFDTLDAGVASIRWMVNRAPAFGAIGPSDTDPRTGEIIDADIGIESLSTRNLRNLRANVVGLPSAAGGLGGEADWAAAARNANAALWAQVLQVAGPPAGDLRAAARACHFADQAAEQLGYALDVLGARDQIDPDSPEAQLFVLAYMKDTTMHEVGHTLGLRHNFRASHIYDDKQVSDPEFSKSKAFAGSVMEYPAINLPRPGEAMPSPFQTTLGAYDYWAIEYGYKPLPAEQEKAELYRIASRSAEPELAYATDEDNFLGVDPDALQFDLGNDPLAFATRRFDIAADLFKRQESRQLKPSEDYSILRRSLLYAVRDAGRAAGTLLRQIGGVRTLRDFPGSGRDPIQPVPAADQRAALDLLSSRVLAANVMTVSPALQRRLAPDFQERLEGMASVPTEFPLAQTVLELQRALLARLMSDGLANRLLDIEAKVDNPSQALRLAELYSRLEADVWGELQGSGDIVAPRRELQRDHINRLSALVLRPGSLSRADARAQVRGQADALAAKLERTIKRPGLSEEARLHLRDGADSLRSALAAKLDRAGV